MTDATDVIVAGDTARRFLADPSMQAIVAGQEQVYFNEWKAAESSSARDAIWARARALSDLLTAMQAVADAGEIEARKSHS